MEIYPHQKLNRFRKVNATKDQLVSIAEQITPTISRLAKMHQERKLEDWAFVYAILIVHAHALIGGKIWGSRLSNKIFLEAFLTDTSLYLQDLFSSQNDNLPYTKKIGPKTSLGELLANWQLKMVPQKAQCTLQHWARKNWNLQIFSRPLEWKEVLALQASGSRCVTVITDPKDLANHVLNERDPWSFTIHDLEHGFQFFSDPVMHRAQSGFYLKTLQALNQGLFSAVPLPPLCKYALSDMNSHPLHMWLTFRQGILDAQSREPEVYAFSFRQLFDLWEVSVDQQNFFMEPKPNPAAADWITNFFAL